MPAEDDVKDLFAISLKLPKVWPSNIELWFAQVESQFALRNITADETKYHHVVAVLDENCARRAAAVISNPPYVDKYETLKDVLLQRCGLSELARAQQLLHLQGLGDRRPTQLLSDMQALRGKMDLEVLFRALFLEQMPEDVRMTLASSTADIEKLASDADEMVQSKASTPPVFAIAKSDRRPWCYYHKKFGKKARRCVAPCDFRPRINEVEAEMSPENILAGRQ